MLPVPPPLSVIANCGLKVVPELTVVEATCNTHGGVVVPIATLPTKDEMEVVVESRLPTVSCEVVAIMPLPVEFAVKIAPFANDTPRARVPDVVIGFPEMVNPVGTDISTEVTVPAPPPPPTHVPLIEKQPAVTLIPFAKVELAVELVTLRRLVAMPPV